MPPSRSLLWAPQRQGPGSILEVHQQIVADTGPPLSASIVGDNHSGDESGASGSLMPDVNGAGTGADTAAERKRGESARSDDGGSLHSRSASLDDGDAAAQGIGRSDGSGGGVVEPPCGMLAGSTPALSSFSVEDAARFVNALGGEARFRHLISQLPDGEAAVALQEKREGMDPAPNITPEGAARSKRRGRRKSKKKNNAVGAKDGPEQPPNPVATDDLSDDMQCLPHLKEIMGATVSHPRFRRLICGLLAELDSKSRASSVQDIFVQWAEDVIRDITLVPHLVTWMESPAGTRFLFQRFGKLRAVQKIKRAVKEAATEMGMIEFTGPAGAKPPTIAMVMHWDSMHPASQDLEGLFDFIPHPHGHDMHLFVAQLVARVLVKVEKFVVTCERDAGFRLTKLRELWFAPTTLGSRRVLQARFAREDINYSNLEPWVVYSETREEIAFVGIVGKEARDPEAQFLDPLLQSRNMTLPDTHAFGLDIFEGEPVIIMYHPRSTETGGRALREYCVGARHVALLRDFVEELKWAPGRARIERERGVE